MSELIEREAVREFIKSYRHSTDVAFDIEKHLDEIPTASPWHRVEDELPDEVGSYLVYAPTYIGGSSSAKECKAGVMFARWLKGGHWSIEVGYYKRPGCVTHWMPIEPPKEDA